MAVTVFVQPGGRTTVTSCGRAPGPTGVRKVGAPFSRANRSSTQLVRTLISLAYTR